jgi:hypothetical protein
MKLSSVKTAVTGKIGRQVLITQKHSPEILIGTGLAGFVATVVLASRATLKMDEVLREAEENNKKIAAAQDVNPENYTDEDAKKDSILNKVQTAGKIAKLYAPALVVGAISVACLAGSHMILNKRNVGLTAAYAAIDKGFKDYRKRVVDELGPEKDAEFRYGVIEKEIAVETDEGTAAKTVKILNPDSGASVYSRVFDDWNKNWQDGPLSYNQMFVSSIQNYCNDRLRSRGHLFLNEVYEALGFEHTAEGAVVGWIANGDGDGFVDFGVFTDTLGGTRFVNGQENTVLLDFNVDGVIWDKIGKGAKR